MANVILDNPSVMRLNLAADIARSVKSSAPDLKLSLMSHGETRPLLQRRTFKEGSMLQTMQQQGNQSRGLKGLKLRRLPVQQV